jgi:hypothetical protein
MRVFVCLAAALSVAVGLIAPGAAGASTVFQKAPDRSVALSPRWIKISSDAGFGGASAGLLRTPDGRLHVLWPADNNGDHSLHYSTVSPAGKLVASGVIVSHWAGIDQYPSLVPDGGGMRAIFDGENGKSGSPYNIGSFYSATAGSSGTTWKLAAGSLSHNNPPLTDNTATSTPSGVPVTAWSEVSSLAYHVGIDPHVPAMTPDVKIFMGSSGGVLNPTLLTSKGVVWGAWFNSSGTATMGYWVDKISAGAAGLRKAPGSGGKGLNNSQPLQPVAFAARAGGGLYMAYCVPTKTLTCGHVALWRAGAAKAMPVPGSASASGQDSKVALAAAPGGHLWVLWFDYHSNVIHAVETNAAATGFGKVETIDPPAHLFSFDGLQANASRGPLSIVALVMQTGTGSSAAYFFAQIGI